MPVLDLSFEWLVDDAGYSIVDHKRKPSKRGGARILTGQPSGPHIVRNGGQLRAKRPLELRSTLFVDFAGLDGTDESCIRFANSWGYLGLIPNEKADDHVGSKGEDLALWRMQINGMGSGVELWQASPDTFGTYYEFPITRLDVSLVPIDGRPTLRIRPSSLIGAIRMQFAQAVATGLDIRNCDHCGKLFELGGGGRTRKARFCSDRCRSDFHVAKRKVPSGKTMKKKGASK